MFGVSFTELVMISVVVLLVVGPARLPKLLGTLGRWSAKLRRITTEVRAQSGIDDMLRKEGISGGLSELRHLRDVARGNWTSLANSSAPRTTQAAKAAGTSATAAAAAMAAAPAVDEDPFADVPYDRSREYPEEGCDAYGALPADLWSTEPTKPALEPLPNADLPEPSAPPAVADGNTASTP